MSRNLLSILQPSDTDHVPNDMDGGSLVVDDSYILFVQKPKMVFIPQMEVAVSMDLSEEARKRRRQVIANEYVESLLWAAVNLRSGARAEQTGSMPCVPERLVLETLQMQLKPSDRIVWLLANTQTAADAAARISTAYRDTKSGPMETMRVKGGPPSDVIIGTTNPVGYYLESKPYVLKGDGAAQEVSTGNGWLVYAGQVAAIQLVS